jgi:isoleucyl-tRNA synthetase
VDPEEKADWEALLAVRDQVLKALEEARKSKAIGSSLEARVRLKAGRKTGSILSKYRDELAELFIVSAVELGELPGAEDSLEIAVENAPGNKCHRCWKYLPSVGRSARHPHACASCTEVLEALEAKG